VFNQKGNLCRLNAPLRGICVIGDRVWGQSSEGTKALRNVLKNGLNIGLTTHQTYEGKNIKAEAEKELRVEA